MPYNPNLSIVIDAVQRDAILADIDGAKTKLAAIAEVTIDPNDVKKLNTIKNKRLPYVQRAVMEFAADYPTLVSPRITAGRAGDLLQAYTSLRHFESKINELADRVRDLSYNVENLLFLFTSDMYDASKRYEGDLVGADIVEDYLKEMFAQNPDNEEEGGGEEEPGGGDA